MRCLLIEDVDRLILIDNGIGNKQSDKFFGYYYLHGDDSLDKSLAAHGFHRDDITDVILTHLHFDHCGGSIEWNDSKDAYRPAFKNAIYWSNEAHWKHATNPNPREKPSFLKENILPIQESGQLKMVNNPLEVHDSIYLRFVDGHTDAMMIPYITKKEKTLIFCADLIPSAGHIPVNYVMAYDIKPLESMRESEAVLEEVVEKNYCLFFEHDRKIECGTVTKNARGGFQLDRHFELSEF
jgi:glyoxylase-like metal-dependent hydrolase (beta-lactamase superfamily II)